MIHYRYVPLISLPPTPLYTEMLKHSIQESGILCPVIVYRDTARNPHIIDGEKRRQYADELSIKDIPTHYLPDSTSSDSIGNIIYALHAPLIQQSAFSRIHFAHFLMNIGISKPLLIQHWFPLLQMPAYSSVWADMRHLCRLPPEWQQFCAEKKRSYSQCLQLAVLPRCLLDTMTYIHTRIPLTSALFDDYLNMITALRLTADSEEWIRMTAILDSGDTTKDIHRQLRAYLLQQYCPALTHTNNRISDIIQPLRTEKVTINWDRTLENKCIDITLRVSRKDEWDTQLRTLSNSTVQSTINRALDIL